MSPEHVATIRRNQERAVRVLYLANQRQGPDPERIANEATRIADQMQARYEPGWWQRLNDKCDTSDRWEMIVTTVMVIICCGLLFAGVLWLPGEGWTR